MKINRDLYLKPFTKNSFYLGCPFCNAGTLSVTDEAFIDIDTKESQDSRMIEDWEPLWIRGLFTSFLRCGNKSCSEIVTVTGTSSVEENYYFDGSNSEYVTECSIVYINPAVNIIRVAEEIPKAIRDMLVGSFSLFWCDIASSGNKIRKVIELVLDEKNVVSGKLTLHNRIEMFGKIEEEKYKSLSEMLMGIKWLANESSHKNESLIREDLLDAYEILDYVLDYLFVRDIQKLDIENKADKLSKKYSPKEI